MAMKSCTKSKKIARFVVSKVVSGLTLFRREKVKEGVCSGRVKLMWKKLPLESKTMFGQRGHHLQISTLRRCMTVRFRPEQLQVSQTWPGTNLAFMHKYMK